MTVIDPRCPDCTATVVVDEQDIHGMRLTVTHSPGCPWLASRSAGKGHAMYSVYILHTTAREQ